MTDRATARVTVANMISATRGGGWGSAAAYLGSRVLTDDAPVLLSMIDPEDKLVFANHRFLSFFGRSLEDIEHESAGERIENGIGGADPACLEPLDVVDAHGGQRSYLFASQSFDTPAAACSEPDVLGLDPRAP